VIKKRDKLKKIYIDESGDDGQVEGSSRYFILCALIIDENEERKMYKIIRELKNYKIFRKHNEIKFTELSDVNRKRFIKKLNNLSKEVIIIVLDKNKLTKRFEKQYLLYEYVSSILVREVRQNSFEVIIDLKNTKKLRERITDLFQKELVCEISHDFSYNSIGLQFADFIVGCYFQKYTYNNISYIDLIEGDIKIIEIK